MTEFEIPTEAELAACHRRRRREYLALESLRVAMNVDEKQEHNRAPDRVQYDGRRGRLDLSFDRSALELSSERDLAALVKVAILPHVPQWRLEAEAYYPRLRYPQP